MKIWLQFALIEEYFFDFVFDVRSTFKGRFCSFSCNNSWLSWFNGCRIESKKDENHDELKIFLQNHLISSWFDQKLLKEENTSVFKGKFLWEMRTIHFAMRFGPSDRAKLVGSWAMTQVSLRLIFAVRSWSGYPYAATCPRMVSRVRDLIATFGSHLRDRRSGNAHMLWWRSGGPRSTKLTRVNLRNFIWRTTLCHVAWDIRMWREHSPTRRKRKKNLRIKGGKKNEGFALLPQ